MGKLIPAVLILFVLVVAGYFVISGKNAKNIVPQNIQTQPQGEQQISDAPISQSAKNLVLATSNGFDPATLTIKAGEEVMWTNNTRVAITVNSGPHPAHTEFPPLNSVGEIAPNQSKTFIFTKAGTYHYHNHLSSSQEGVVIVK